MTDRDRDARGRARNARPRDRLGRPLPRDAEPAEGVPEFPDDFELPPDESLAYAQRLIDQGLAFSAHEVLEAAWKNGPDDQRTLWQGLAQIAVAVTHVLRGNRTGALTLFDRAAWRLGQVDLPAPYGIDIPGLLKYAAARRAELDAGTEVAPERLRPRLIV